MTCDGMRTPGDAELRRLDRVKRVDRPAGELLGPAMVQFFKQSVEKRHTKLGKIAACWDRLVPQTLNEHCALESYNRGSLTVIVDSSPHLYELKQLLLAGLQHPAKLLNIYGMTAKVDRHRHCIRNQSRITAGKK